jgi:hypothetical protein
MDQTARPPTQSVGRHVPNTMADLILSVCGLRWHGPISVVGAPSRSDGYGVVAPPRGWSRGHPGDPCVSTGGGPLYFFNSLLVEI